MTKSFPQRPLISLLLACTALAIPCQCKSEKVPLATVQSSPAPHQSYRPSEEPSPTTRTPESAQTEQYTLSHERYEKAVAYSRAGYLLYFVSYFLSALVLALLLWLGFAANFRDIAERATENKWLQGLIFIPLLVITTDLLDLPLRVYWHSLSLRYEQSIQSWPSWAWDWAKSEFLGIALAIGLGLILSAVIHRSPRRWWIHFWLATLPLLLFFVLVAPWVIDPMFNKFQPLADTQPQLVNAIAALTNRAGVPIPPQRMFLMDASQKTNTINAYVTGIGASKRVVVWDTTLQKTTNDEALFIVGHELGHYVLGHVWKGLLFFAASLLAALYVMFRGLHWALQRWGTEWKVYSPEDWASFAVFLLLLQLLTFISSPVISGFSRMQEHAADVYGLEVIHGIVPHAEQVAAHAFQVIGELDLSDPNPPAFITFWLYSHPPLAERLVFAHSYDPWSKGEAPQYVK